MNITYPTGTPYIYGNSITPTWNAYPKAKLYRVQLEIFGGALVEEKTTTDLTCTFTGITDEYYVIKVRAERDTDHTDWATEYFEIENIGVPVYKSPSDGEHVIAYGGLPKLVSIEFSVVESFTNYRQQCASDAKFTHLIDDKIFTESPYDVEIGAYGNYYLRSRVEEGGVIGDWSLTRSFSLESE